MPRWPGENDFGVKQERWGIESDGPDTTEVKSTLSGAS